jgi:hypothetical protein
MLGKQAKQMLGVSVRRAVPPLDVSAAVRFFPSPRLDSRIHPKFSYAKRRFPIILKCRHIYRVLNVDEIKN